MAQPAPPPGIRQIRSDPRSDRDLAELANGLFRNLAGEEKKNMGKKTEGKLAKKDSIQKIIAVGEERVQYRTGCNSKYNQNKGVVYSPGASGMGRGGDWWMGND